MAQSVRTTRKRRAAHAAHALQLSFFPSTFEVEPKETVAIRPVIEEAPRNTFTLSARIKQLYQAAQEAITGRTLPRTTGEVVRFGERVLGTSYAAEEFALDEVYDAMEGAAYAHARTTLGPVPETGLKDWLRNLWLLEEDIFRGRALSEDARALAQFSTPLPLGGAAAALLSAERGWTIAEPSAGTGGLLWALPRGVIATATDLCRRRVAVLRAMGIPATKADALRAPLEKTRYRAALLNPPYGAARTGRYRGFGATEFTAADISQRFVASALQTLQEGGRLVAVLPANTLGSTGARFREWLSTHHTPLAFIPNPPESYRTRGALGETLLLLAERDRAEDAPVAAYPKPETEAEWAEVIEQMRAGAAAPPVSTTTGAATPSESLPVQIVVETTAQDEEPTAPEPQAAAEAPQETTAAVEVAAAPEPAAKHDAAAEPEATTDNDAAVEEDTAAEATVEAATETEDAPDDAPHAETQTNATEGVVQPEPSDTGDETPQPAEADQPRATAEPEAQPLDDGSVISAQPKRRNLKLIAAREGEMALPPAEAPRATPDLATRAREMAAAETSPIFAPYLHGLPESRSPHPRLVVETRTMAGMEAPSIIEKFESPLADAAWGRDGAYGGVSDEQADLALRALSAWKRGHGFLCADDVGVGKSREIALLMLEMIERGHTRILFTTKNANNIADFRDELARVTSGSADGPLPAHLIDVSNFKEVKSGTAHLPRPDGPTIYMSHSYNFEPFAEALARTDCTVWLADEAHEFKNVAGSKRGMAWATLHQHMLARKTNIAYFTATPAVTLDELSYLYGLRLWGVGAFEGWLDRKTGHRSAKTDDKATQAAVAVHVDEAVRLGESSGIDSDEAAEKGKLKFMRARTDAFTLRTTPAETEQIMRELKGSGHYVARDLWRGGVDFRVEELDLLGDSDESRAARTRYDTAAALCRDVSMASRKFGRMNDEVKTAGLDRAMIQGYLKQLLFDLRLPRVLTLADAALAAGKQVVISVHSVAGDGEKEEGLSGAEEVAGCNTRLESAINRINTREIKKEEKGDAVEYMDLGDIPEALFARAELLDRVRNLPPLRDPIRRIEEHFGAHRVASITGRVPAGQRTRLMGEFQSGQRSVAVISRAGKVGISLHDVNRRPRAMIVADYEWSADLFKQELGRVDRTGQLSSPEVALVASNVAGERRFAATIAARMASLGATSKGSAESTGTDALDIFDMSGGVALEAMKSAVEHLGDELRSYFTGSKFVEFMRTEDGSEKMEAKRRPDGADMRNFLLELLMFPVLKAHQVMDAWEKEREALMTGETIEMLSARRTGRQSGEILRHTVLSESPALVLYEIRNDADERRALVQGFVTEFIYEIQKARGTDSQGRMKSRRYLQFTPTTQDGLLSGLEVTPTEGARILQLFDKLERHEVTPETAREDLRAGDKVPVYGPNGAGWMLHLRQNGRVEIRGAQISKHRDALLIPDLRGVVRYESAGNYLYFNDEKGALEKFFHHYPPIVSGSEERQALAA